MPNVKRKIVKIEWEDACSHNEDWWPEDKISNEGITTESIGFIVKENKTHITIANSFNDVELYNGILTIPKKYIKKKRIIKS